MTLDTSPEALRIQEEIVRALGPDGRLALACQMSEMVRELARAGIRARHPQWPASRIHETLLQELYGDSADSR